MSNFNLNDLNLDDIGQWPLPAKITLISILSLFVVFLGYWFLVKPNFDEYASLGIKQKELLETFEVKHAQAVNLQAYINQMQIMKDKFGAMLRQLPAENEMPGLLEDISRTGVASGLSFELFAPKPEVKHDFYTELPIDIIVYGSYHQLALFLSRVGQLDRIVTLHDLSVEPVKLKNTTNPASTADNTKGSGDGLLEMKITAKIYRYNTQ